MRQAAALVRALAATAGDAAVRRALPAYAGLVIASGLLFGGNGLEPTTVIAGADDRLFAALLWSAWLLLAATAVEPLWRAPTSFWLRSLPVPRAWHLAVLLGFTLVAESPWFLLWLLGGGLLSGLAALGGALAVHALALARPPGLPGLLLVLLALAVAVVAPPLHLSLGSWPIALVAFRRAWLAAPARSGHHARATIRGPAPVALALAHLTSLLRAHLPILLRAALLAGLAAAAAWLAARNNQYSDLPTLLTYAAGFLTLPALLAGSAVALPLLALESRAAWLLVVTTPRTRLAAHALAAACFGALLALPAALALARVWQLAPLPALSLLAALTLTGASLTTLATLLTRWAARYGTRAAGRQLLALLLAAILTLVLLSLLGARTPLAWAALALSAWLLGHVLSASHSWPLGHVLSASPTTPPGGAPVLTLTAVRKRLGARLVLDDVDLACPPGAIALVLGENGAGKSTLLRITAGILEPDAGSVTIAGALLTSPAPPPSAHSAEPPPSARSAEPPHSAPSAEPPHPAPSAEPPHPAPSAEPSPTARSAEPPPSLITNLTTNLAPALAARRALGYAPDTADAFPDLAVRESLLALVAALKRAPLPPDALRDRLGLTPIWHQRLRTLSFGQVKRTYLFAALVGDPALLILDEPSNGLDPDGARTVADLLRERAAAGRSALVATNDAAFAARLGGAVHRLHAARLTPDGALPPTSA